MAKKWLKRFALVLLPLIVLFFAFLCFERFRGQISLADYKRQLTAQGEPLDYANLHRAPIPDADNGTPELLKLTDEFKEGKVIPTTFPPRMKMVAPGRALVGYEQDFWIEDKVTNTWADVALDITSNSNVLEQTCVVLSKKTGFESRLQQPFDFQTFFPQLPKSKKLCQWLATAFQDALRRKDHNAALRYLNGAISIPRLLENDRLTISELVRIAISAINFANTWEALNDDGWTDEQLASIQRTWERNEFVTNYVQGLRGEMLFAVDEYKKARGSNDVTYSMFFPEWSPIITGEAEPQDDHWWQLEFFRKQVYCRIWRFAWSYQDEKHYLEGIQQLIHDNRTGADRAAKNPDDNWLGLPIAKKPRLRFFDDWRFGSSEQSLATLDKASVKAMHAETERSLVLCAIALRRYSLAHNQAASSLDALVPEFLKSVPLDYMDGKPIKYRLNPDGSWVLYSVGDDGIDDGGDPSPPTGETRSWIWKAKDVVWPARATPEEMQSYAQKIK